MSLFEQRLSQLKLGGFLAVTAKKARVAARSSLEDWTVTLLGISKVLIASPKRFLFGNRRSS